MREQWNYSQTERASLIQDLRQIMSILPCDDGPMHLWNICEKYGKLYPQDIQKILDSLDSGIVLLACDKREIDPLTRSGFYALLPQTADRVDYQYFLAMADTEQAENFLRKRGLNGRENFQRLGNCGIGFIKPDTQAARMANAGNN